MPGKLHRQGRNASLAALNGMGDLWITVISQSHLRNLKAELRDKAVGELPAEKVLGEEIHERHQVELLITTPSPLLPRCVGWE
jgi:hypothetical protein